MAPWLPLFYVRKCVTHIPVPLGRPGLCGTVQKTLQPVLPTKTAHPPKLIMLMLGGPGSLANSTGHPPGSPWMRHCLEKKLYRKITILESITSKISVLHNSNLVYWSIITVSKTEADVIIVFKPGSIRRTLESTRERRCSQRKASASEEMALVTTT